MNFLSSGFAFVVLLCGLLPEEQIYILESCVPVLKTNPMQYF